MHIVGMDSSHKLMFIGIVIGKWSNIKNCWLEISVRLGLDEIHMYKLKSDLKKKTLRLLCRYCCGLNLICIKINYPRLRNTARNIRPRAPKRKIIEIVNTVVRDTLCRIIEEYSTTHTIIVDRELEEIMSIKDCEPREPIEIADIVAWYNLRTSNIPKELRRNLKRCITEIDVEHQIVRALYRKIRTRHI